MQELLSFRRRNWKRISEKVAPFLFLLLTVGCFSGIEPSQSRATSAISSSTLTSVASTVTPTFTLTPVEPTDPPTLEPTFTKTPLLTPTPVATPLPLITEPASPVPILTGSTKNYMLLGGDTFWHPDLAHTTGHLKDMSFGRQPWSPDGLQLVTLMRTNKSAQDSPLGIVTLETGELTLLENAPFATSRLPSPRTLIYSPSWSPDGRYLLYAISTEEDQDFFQIVLYDLATAKETLLASPVQLLRLGGWSFDSQEIAYIRWDALAGEEGKSVLEIMDVASQTVRQLEPPTDLSIGSAQWSPTSKHLALYIGGIDLDGQTTYAYEEIYLIDTQTGVFEQLKAYSTREDDPYGDPDSPGYFVLSTPWSPDGQSIIYSDRGLLCSLVITSRQEICFTELDKQLDELGAVSAEYPAWSPSGEWISFVMKLDSEACSPIAAVRPDGSDLRFTYLEDGDCAQFGTVWSPAK